MLLILILVFTSVALFPQEKMTVKPRDFNPAKVTDVQMQNVINQNGYSVSGTSVVTQYPNTKVFISPVKQSEPSVTVSKTPPYRIFIGANTDYGVGYYYSSNSGANFSGDNIMPGSVYYSTNPFVSYNNSNILYYNYLDDYNVVDRSFNYGINWGGRMVVPSTTQFDMNSIAVDNNPASSYYNRIYVVWSNFNLSQPAVFFSYSTNNGATFTAGVQIGSPQSNHYEQGARLAVGPNGDVYCVWATPNIANNNIEDKIAFVKSVNGGTSWSAPVYPLTISGIRGYLSPNGIRVNSFPSIAIDRSGGAGSGRIYLFWAQKNLAPAGSDPDICFSYSANGGSSFSSPVRINDDPLNNGKNQFLPWCAADDATGKVTVVFYDNRDTFIPDSVDVYAAISPDNGGSFVNIKVSDHAHRPFPLSGYADGYYSDYIGVAVYNDVIYPAWTDTRDNIAQIFSAAVTPVPYIMHTPLKDRESTTGQIPVFCLIKPIGAAVNAGETKLFFGSGSITDSIAMTQGTGNNWSASITATGTPSIYFYYLKTKDTQGRESRLPVNAPSQTFSFRTGTDTSKPVISHVPPPLSNWITWPDTLKAIVFDNTGIDSVWVRWYRNNPSTGIKHFRLNNITGDFFRGFFNSTRPEIQPNDSVFYRIFAADNSGSHNIDSTGLFSLFIYSQVFLELGNEALPVSYPFGTFYMDSKTDLLIPASEITAVWGNSPGRVVGIAFNILNVSPIAMNGLTIKIQNTNLTSLSGFTGAGWTTFWSGNYSIQNTGWGIFYQQTPFIWNGTSGLLIEVCYNNSSVNINSAVKGSLKPGLTWHEHQDLVSGSGCNDLNAGSAQTKRPNIGLVLNAIVGINEVNEIINEYSLLQNYPNPFNPVTKITFDIPGRSFVELKIFDVLGREVSKPVSEEKREGRYTIDFDGSSLSSGVYFYTLNAGDYVQTKKMLLIK
ncbi:MAG: T9SS type A sorting domain-containing protein [Ignavibacteria bacterium]|nr:T9SS type A sorting domain-containing protein [Ignavibacteria bacterium]